MSTKIITIDGPAGAGKTTISKLLSQRLGIIYVDTGALYRGVAYEINKQAIEWEDDAVLEVFLKELDLNFTMEDNSLVLMSCGQDISRYIRTPEISMLASTTSAKPQVRAALLDIQRKIAGAKDAVFEGRDMGTVVFPEAEYKFFLFADIAVRAKRRFDEMVEKMPDKISDKRSDKRSGKRSGKNEDIDKVKLEMQIRDENDSQRKAAPLKPANDAIKIDATHLSIEQVVSKMFKIIEKEA